MKNILKVKRAILVKNYAGHDGALYKGDVVVLKEITSKKIKVTDALGKIYWLSPDFIENIS
jgi:hypothetical protein|tara:strand:- start:554 stop:736 length:183 start_codon:yes stop_codon:yes gene_type:complete